MKNPFTTLTIIDKKGKKTGLPVLDLPSLRKDTIEQIYSTEYLEGVDTYSKASEWAECIREGGVLEIDNGALNKVADDPNRNWSQQYEHDGKVFKSSEGIFNELTNRQLEGKRAIAYYQRTRKIGNVFNVYLPHSGFWVSVEPPSNTSIVNLTSLITQTTISLGRETKGLYLSCDNIFTNSHITDHVLSHIKQTNIKNSPHEDLSIMRKLVKPQDLPIVFWGGACSKYRDGVVYRHACINKDVEKHCNTIYEEKLNLDNLCITDYDVLDEVQKKNLIQKGAGSLELEDIESYQNKLHKPVTYVNKTELDGEELTIKITIESPNLHDYFNTGMDWINGLVDTVEGFIDSSKELDQDKESLLEVYNKSTKMRTYHHWITKIELDTNIITDKQTIGELLTNISSTSDDGIFIAESVNNYINQTTISLVGIPEFDCTNCGKLQETIEHEGLSKVIPLDYMQLFILLALAQLAKTARQG